MNTGPCYRYLEGSARIGTLHNEYGSNGLCDANDTVAEFDMDSPYCNLQGGSGYVCNMAEEHSIDICSKVYLDQGGRELTTL